MGRLPETPPSPIPLVDTKGRCLPFVTMRGLLDDSIDLLPEEGLLPSAPNWNTDPG